MSKIKLEWDLNGLYTGINDKNLMLDVDLALNAWQNFEKNYLNCVQLNEKFCADFLEAFSNVYEKHKDGGKGIFYLYLVSSLDSNNLDSLSVKNLLLPKVNEIRSILTKVEIFISKHISLNFDLDKFGVYKTFIRRISDFARYYLSDSEESIILRLSKTSNDNWIVMSSRLRSNLQKKVKTQDGTQNLTLSEITKYSNSEIDSVRKSAYKALKKIKIDLSDISEMEMNSIMEFKYEIEKLRGIKRPEDTALIRDDISYETVDAMITTVKDSMDLCRDFFKFKAKILGVKRIEPWNVNIELGKLDPKFRAKNNKYSLNETIKIVSETLQDLDNDFYTIFDAAINESRIDALPKKGKRSGAFCASYSKQTPVYILMNAIEQIDDVTTLAHETGHMIHSELQRKNLEIYYDVSLATAEVSSTFFEDFAFDKACIHLKDKIQIFGLKVDKFFDQIYTIHMQASGYLFERNLHKTFREKGYLSKHDIDELLYDELKNFYGNVTNVSDFKDRWIIWPHLRSPFYLYSYAMGLLISKSLQFMVKNNTNSINKVKEFMSYGNSLSPVEIFNNIGINITDQNFWMQGISMLRMQFEGLKKDFHNVMKLI